ncbi:hypothetical protein EJD97_024169 [Solanum chilense]|uniref:Uncharacterized protein n=1 Tax=Solanum chilense TaxID=4083 RepID=A0A6N2C9V5_SOLCI|nr:hypothetical protein EJD97_024169 [Solanum chilense]
MKDKMGVIVPYMQPGVIVPCEDIKNNIGVIVPYGLLCPVKTKKNDRGYCALYAIKRLLCHLKT